MSVFEHPEFDSHEHVAFFHDSATGLKAIIAIHNTNLGPSLGGCRMWPYLNSAEALTDVLRLSKGMTYKAAMANLQQGGGKSVIIGDPRQHKNEAFMQAMGRFVESFNGQYVTAEDSGITVADLQAVATQTQHVAGTHALYNVLGETPTGNPAPSTAYGVFVGLKQTVKHVLNSNLNGVKVAIQGMGHVGYRLAKQLHEEGAELYVADIFPEGLAKAEQEFGAKIVAPEDILSLPVDVIAPCAMGSAINDESLPDIRAKIIAGAANNQLAREELGQALHQRGICYAPDYVINAGGIIDIYHQKKSDSSDDALRAHIDQIGDTLSEVYQRAEEQSLATNIIANRIAEERFSK
ncbi:Glu/Leu/Phe/Val dehydrogenase dimerization domain-containing protein [Alteromonas gilva]|uniref:Glu/Leu/Phe/Val dehydrogenase dimerization domain-containing protein n=1 Tax=Alteromonas gilva TaxID=2987522 RepID=A0ABT5L492_9ALTE|nr:Glu/Leu/Phe/Val dehydrogenase dimerization domain-containing protein [Alteromonas gilva]MDC8831673.1 Glu/Leu/Phe/Val dehydrogenase dimerization domain-containing protein [Alteromonas gilva]